MGGAFVYALMEVLLMVIHIVMFLIIVRAVISWFSPSPYNQIVQFLYGVTEPMLNPIRRLLPRTGRFDLSPMVAILVLIFLKLWITRALGS